MGTVFFYQKFKNRAPSRLLAKIRVSQVFWEPIKNRVSPRSALLEAAYLEALLYITSTVNTVMTLPLQSTCHYTPEGYLYLCILCVSVV